MKQGSDILWRANAEIGERLYRGDRENIAGGEGRVAPDAGLKQDARRFVGRAPARLILILTQAPVAAFIFR